MTKIDKGQTAKVTAANGTASTIYTIPSTGLYAILATKDVIINGGGKMIIGSDEYSVPQHGTIFVKELSNGTEIKFVASQGSDASAGGYSSMVKYTIFELN